MQTLTAGEEKDGKKVSKFQYCPEGEVTPGSLWRKTVIWRWLRSETNAVFPVRRKNFPGSGKNILI